MNPTINIYSPEGTLLREHTLSSNCGRKFSLMSEDSVTLHFYEKESKKFPVGSYLTYPIDGKDAIFYITHEQKGKWNASTGVWDYELKFDAYYWLWKNKILRYIIPNVDSAKETSFTLTATIDIHANVILRCLSELGFKYDGSYFGASKDDTVTAEAKLVSYENLSILGGIQAIAQAFDCEWWVIGNMIYFGKCGYKRLEDDNIADALFTFEAGGNVSSISFSQSKEETPNRFYIYGSDRNLPSNYRKVDGNDTINGVVNKRLMLPKYDENGNPRPPYLQTKPNLPESEIVEKVIVLDSVYPRTELTISDVETYTADGEDNEGNATKETFYRIKYGNSFLFSESYILPNEELHIVFQSGKLNGMDFGARFNPKGLNEKNADGSWNLDAQMLEIVANENYGRKLPDAILKPEAGENPDKFILYGWDATKMEDLGLIADAEAELLEEGEKEVKEQCKDLSSCTCPMAWDYMKPLFADNKQPKPGDEVTIIDTAHFGEGGRKSRIIGYEFKLDKPYAECTYTCGENVSVKRLDNLEQKIEGLAKTGSKIQMQNALDFLSKRYADRTPYLLSSDKGFEAGRYIAGSQGGFFGMDADGDSFADVARLWVRVKAYFEELTVIKSNVLAGKQYITPGGGIKCTEVKEIKDVSGTVKFYRCYFLSGQDGEGVECKFKVNDQAICEQFNVKDGTTHQVSNRHYWRLVTAVVQDDATKYDEKTGNHYGYIQLSASNCQSGSDIPQAGDEICQLGYQGSDTANKDRQSAMVFSTVDSDSPSVKLYAGINSFTLEGKSIISFGHDVNGVYFRLGNSSATQYLTYNQTDGLTISGRLSVNSTIGDQSINDYFTSLLPDDSYLREALEQYSVIDGGLFLTSCILLGYKDEDGLRHNLAGMNGIYHTEKSPFLWGGGSMEDRYYDENGTLRETPLTSGYANAMIRMDGSAYFGGGAHAFHADGTGWLGSQDGIRFDGNGVLTLGSGIRIDINGDKELKSTLQSVLNFQAGLDNFIVPCDADGQEISWEVAMQNDGTGKKGKSVKVKVGLWGVDYISAHGLNGDGGTGGGGGATALRMLTDVSLPTDIPDGHVLSYDSTQKLWVNKAITIPSLAGYATQSWVEGKGYVTSDALGDYVTLGGMPQTITGAKVFRHNTIRVSDAREGYLNVLSSTNTALPTSARDYKWQWYHCIQNGNPRGFTLCSYDGDGTVFNIVAMFKAEGGNAFVVNGAIKKMGGTSAQFLKADGSVDSNSYLTTEGNASSASKLQTSRTLWGQSFDGTGNVTGSLASVTDITMSGSLYMGTLMLEKYSWGLQLHSSNADPVTFGCGGLSVSEAGGVNANMPQYGIYSEGGIYSDDIIHAQNGISSQSNISADGEISATEGFVTSGGVTANSVTANSVTANGADGFINSVGSTQRASLALKSGASEWRFGTQESSMGALNITAKVSNTNKNIVSFINDGRVEVYGVVHTTDGIWSDDYVSARGDNTSDARLKTDISPFRATDIIMRLSPRSFKWNALARSKFSVFDTDSVQYGLIAQDVERTDPWLVADRMFGDEYKGIRYQKLIPVLLQGQREQNAEVTELKLRIRDLEKRICELEMNRI